MIDYTLTRSKRKTIAIYIRGGSVEVRAPLKTPLGEINRFVLSKEKWIKKHLPVVTAEKSKRDNFSLNYGDVVAYRGKLYAVTGSKNNRIGVSENCFYIPPNLPPERIKAACIGIYKILAECDLIEKVYFYAEKMGVTPAAVKINSAETRWGSCSAKKNINFSWRLIMADDEAIDYVVVHELAHIKEMNHSARFWAIVEAFVPDFRERKKRLRAFQEKLNTEDWD